MGHGSVPPRDLKPGTCCGKGGAGGLKGQVHVRGKGEQDRGLGNGKQVISEKETHKIWLKRDM